MDFRGHALLAELEETMKTRPEHFVWLRKIKPSHNIAHNLQLLSEFNIDMGVLPDSCILCKVIECDDARQDRRALIAASDDRECNNVPILANEDEDKENIESGIFSDKSSGRSDKGL